MPFIMFEQPPIQDDFSEEDVRNMNGGRRQLRTEWEKTIYPPDKPDGNWRLILPFENTFQNAFATMCTGFDYHSHLAKDGRLVIFLNGTTGDKEPPADIVPWVETVGRPVAMKDFLAISFALDYERAASNPKNPQTEVGTLRSQAKPYGGSAATDNTKGAADKLVALCVEFLRTTRCYASADCIVAMPPSDSAKDYNLPNYMAEHIAKEMGIENLSDHVRTCKARNSIKGVPLAKKLDTLLGTIEVDTNVFSDRNVILLDDLYQSGTSMNYCGLLLRQAGARKIFGLACEKTCRNDDNVGGKM